MQNQNQLTNPMLKLSHNALVTKQTTNQIAKQIINQATKIKQILLSTSIKLFTLISVLTLNNYLYAMTPSRTDQTKSDRMAELAKRAEDMYAASSAAKAAVKVPTPVVTPAPTAVTIETAKLESDKSKPGISGRLSLENPLDKHGEITDKFWAELSKCKECPSRTEHVDCQKMLAANSAWQIVIPMDRETKRAILDKIDNSMTIYDSTYSMTNAKIMTIKKKNDPLFCNIICAICAGADPNYKDPVYNDSLLAWSALSGRFGLFKLLLEKGADHSDASKICEYVDHPKHLRKRLPDEYKDDYFGELEKYGQKCTESRSQLRDTR